MRAPVLGGAIFALLAVIAMAGTVHAQPADSLRTTQYDTLGLAADAEAIPFRRLMDTGRCGVVGNAVLTDSAGLRRLRRYPQCADVVFPEPEGRTLVGLSIMGDCNATYRVDVFRSESRREYRVRVRQRYGGCRAGNSAEVWIELPALPPGWTVTAQEERSDEEVDLSAPGWTSIRG